MIANSREDRVEDKHVLINKDTGRIWVNGEEIPFLMAEPGPEIDLSNQGIAIVNIPLIIFAKDIIIVDTDPEEDQ